MRSSLRCLPSVFCCALIVACGGGGDDPVAYNGPLRIYHSPYAAVDWTTAYAIKAQHHDHNAANLTRIRAYDSAGYQAVSLMDYSGDPDHPYALTSRLWPPEDVGVSTDFQRTLRHVAFFIPNAEEIGESSYHMTSPFLTTYIEKFHVGLPYRTPMPWQYTSPQELIDFIAAYGGIPLLAHPWNDPSSYSSLRRFRGTEIYSAQAAAKRRAGDANFVSIDRNARLLALWDRLLASDQSIIGIAVNDHYGPDSAPDSTDPDIRDSGKIVVYAPALNLDAYRDAFQRGALVAVKDVGQIKDRVPALRSISVEATSVFVDTDGAVTWVANGGRAIGRDALLEFSNLPVGTTYVRAEISNAEGSTIYTQAFAVRPVGDANGDGSVDATDSSVCSAVQAGTDADPDHIAAC